MSEKARWVRTEQATANRVDERKEKRPANRVDEVKRTREAACVRKRKMEG